MLQQGNYLHSLVSYPLRLFSSGVNTELNGNKMDITPQIPTLVENFDELSSNGEEDAHNGGSDNTYKPAAVINGKHSNTGVNTDKSDNSNAMPTTDSQKGNQTPDLSEEKNGEDEGAGKGNMFMEDSKHDVHQHQSRPPHPGVASHTANFRRLPSGNELSHDACGSSESSSGSFNFSGNYSNRAHLPVREEREVQRLRERNVAQVSNKREQRKPEKGGRHVPLENSWNDPTVERGTGKKRQKSPEPPLPPQAHQGISSLLRTFTAKDFTWTILKCLDDQLVDRDLVQLKFLCKDSLTSSQLQQVTRACELFEFLQSRVLISGSRVHMVAELMYRIRRIDLLKKLVTDTKTYQQLIENSPTSLNKYRILLHEICEDTLDKEFKTMKFFVREHFTKPKLDGMKEPQDLFVALEQKDRLGADNLDLLIRLMEAADKRNMVHKILQFRGSHYPDNPPPLDVFNKQLEFEERNRMRNYAKEATAQFAAGSLRPRVENEIRDRYHEVQERRPLETQGLAYRIIEEQQQVGGHLNDVYPNVRDHLNDNDRPSMLISVGAQGRIEDEVDGDLPCYKMDASPRGLCVIFNNQKFHKVAGDDSSKELKPREGSDVDMANLEYTFNELDFKVELYNDVDAKQLVNTLHSYAMSVDHSNYDCFACCILTHGKQDKLYGSDGKLVEVRELTNFFKAAFCPSLRGKPKLFFIQACQGREKQQGYMPEQRQHIRDLETDDAGHVIESRDSIPNEADFLLAYATLPGFVSYRSRTHGSWFVNALVTNIERYSNNLVYFPHPRITKPYTPTKKPPTKAVAGSNLVINIETYYHEYDLLSIMIKVNEEVSKMMAPMSDGEYKQVPLPHPTLRKRIFFRKTRA